MEQKIVYIILNIGAGAILIWLSIIFLEKFYLKAESSSDDFNLVVDFVRHAYHNSGYQATSGERIPDYIDADAIMENPIVLEKTISKVVEHLRDYIKKHPEAKVCFIEKDSGPLGMLAYAGLISTQLSKPISTIRPRRDILRMAVEGLPIEKGDGIILVQDVLTTNFQVIQAKHKIEQFGAHVVAVVTLVDRRSEEYRALSDESIEIISEWHISEIVKAKREANNVAAS